jgi:hypothetical protein
MAAPVKTNLIINQRSDFRASIVVRDSATSTIVNLTGYSVVAKLKQTLDSPDSSAVTFVCAIPAPLTGIFTMELTDVTTAALRAGSYVYDVVLVDTDGFRTRIIQGTAKVDGGIS